MNWLPVVIFSLFVWNQALRADESGRELENLKIYIEEAKKSVADGILQIRSESFYKNKIESGMAYNVMETSLDWSDGDSSIAIAKAKPGFSAPVFLSKSKNHILLSHNVLPACGMRGYVVFLGSDFYVSFANWTSLENLFQCLELTGAGEIISSDANSYMDTKFFGSLSELPEDYIELLK